MAVTQDPGRICRVSGGFVGGEEDVATGSANEPYKSLTSGSALDMDAVCQLPRTRPGPRGLIGWLTGIAVSAAAVSHSQLVRVCRRTADTALMDQPNPLPDPLPQLVTSGPVPPQDAGDFCRALTAALLLRAAHAWQRTWPGGASCLPLLAPDVLAWARQQPVRQWPDPTVQLLGSFDDIVTQTPTWFEGDEAVARRFVLKLVGAGLAGASLPFPNPGNHLPELIFRLTDSWATTAPTG